MAVQNNKNSMFKLSVTARRRRRLEPGHEKSRKSWVEPGTTTVALVDVQAVEELSSNTSCPMLGGEE